MAVPSPRSSRIRHGRRAGRSAGDAETSGPICASVTRTARAIWKPDVNGPTDRGIGTGRRAMTVTHYRAAARPSHARTRPGARRRRWERPSSTRRLSFDVVSRATVIEIAGLLVNSAPVMRPTAVESMVFQKFASEFAPRTMCCHVVHLRSAHPLKAMKQTSALYI